MKLLKAPTETAAITVEPGGLAGLEQSTPDLPFMLDLSKKIKSGTRRIMPLVAMRAAGAYVIKIREGYAEHGGDRRSRARVALLKPRTPWKDFCPQTFDGASKDTIDREIKIFLKALDRAKDQEGGEQSPEYRLLTTPPWLLNSDDLETMADALEKLLPEKNQNQLLRKIRLANAPKPPHTLSKADRQKAAAAAAEAKKAKKKRKPTPEQARIITADFIDSLTSFSTEAKGFSYDCPAVFFALPLRKDCEPDQTALEDYRAEFEIHKTALEADLAKILTAFDEFIAAKMEGDAATAADVSKRSRKSSKTSKK
jgi:hypothetical protein